MSLRVFFLLALVFACITSAALADLDIKKARYGNTSAYRDVRGVLEAYLRNNTLSFPVNSRSMGGNPNPRQTDFLFVVYEVNGREFTDTVPEGGIFTFKGLSDVRPVRPPLNLPFLPPSAPLSAPLVVVNRTGLTIRVYNVDRFGQWVWAANMIKGQTITLQARVGETWIAADFSNRVLGSNRISRGQNMFVVDSFGGGRPGRW